MHQVQESSSSMAALAPDHSHTWHGGVPPPPTHQNFNDSPSASSGANTSDSEEEAEEEGWDSGAKAFAESIKYTSLECIQGEYISRDGGGNGGWEGSNSLGGINIPVKIATNES
ncbi:hypothetical protein J437_LFUL014706 [Ladona fulva]|uniref:Uncharacterized protein n=1 Tax=Ladona fulva TaxID=123851 RepID=A0A8K0K9W6_LADFU|nr:hypothetical protein J437_LFUL014706 [Ladona fulva]